MQTAAKVVSGRKYQTCVGIFATRKKMRKQISAPIKAVPAKKAAVSASSSAASGKTRITQRAIARIASAIHSQRNQASVGAIASERFVHINAGRKPICDNTDQSCASRIIALYGSSDTAAGTPIASAASAFLKSRRRILTAAAAAQTANSRNEF